MSGDTLVKILLGETLGPVGRLPGDASGDTQPCRLPQVNCFVPTQLVKNKSMIAVTGVERFHCEEENTNEGNALGYLDCQGGLSVPETRLELAYASSENPQNTLARSKARRVCA